MSESKSELGFVTAKNSMAESQDSLIKRKSGSSSCRICLSSITNPALLTCGHKFCEKCLDKYWQLRDKPEYITCPLCRTSTFNIDFAEKDESSSTEDFRKTFEVPTEESNSSLFGNAATLCIRLSIIMPFAYFILDLLKPLASKLLSYLFVKFEYEKTV